MKMHRTKSMLANSRAQARDRRAFTIIELLIGVVIIGVLAGLLIVSVRAAVRATKGSADTQSLSTVRLAIDKFKQDFGFLPPLVHDNGETHHQAVDPIYTSGRPVIVDVSEDEDAEFLRTTPVAPAPDTRYSVRSLAYYLVGVLDAKSDGVDGPGFRPPTSEGNFRLSDRTVNQPMLDLGKSSLSIYAEGDAKTTGRYELRDRKNNAIRYYRWLSGREEPVGSKKYVVEKPEDLNVPAILGDIALAPRLRDAQYAVVAAGEDGLFGDEPLAQLLQKLGLASNTTEAVAREKARADNVVEVGK